MRVLQVIHDFVPETLAGAEINTHKLSTDLASRGHEVYVFCRGWKLDDEPYTVRDQEFDGLKVRRVDFGTAGKAHRANRHDPNIDAAFIKYMEEVKPDIIHFQHFIYLTTDLVKLAKQSGAYIMVSLRNFWFRCPWGTLLYHDNTLCHRHADLECLSCLWPDESSRKRKVIPWPILNPILINMYRAGLGKLLPKWSEPRQIMDSTSNWVAEFREALLQADLVHSPSQFLADLVIDFGMPRDRVVVIENGIRYDPATIRPKTTGDKLRLGHIGISKHKGVEVSVEAMRHVPRGMAELRVFGKISESYKAQLQELAGDADVTFMGPFKQEHIYDLFSELDALIVPSIWYENCPTVIREAFATRTPVITSNIGGMAEAVRDGVDGLHFEVGNPKDLGAKLKRLIDDPALVRKFQANIKLPPTAESVSDQIEAIYHQFMNKNEQASGQENIPEVSVVIPAYNEEKYIGICLDSLVRQTYSAYEVIVVDDGSTDSTVNIVQGYVAKNPRFQLVQSNHQGPGPARNLAAKEIAKGDILLFLDADMAFEPDFVEKLIAPIRAGTAVGTFSKEEYVLNYTNIWARSWNLHDGMSNDKRHPDDWPDEEEVFRAVDRQKFLEVGGFSPKGSGDDNTLSKKLNAKAKAAPGAICYHHNPDTVGEVYRQARWYARGARLPISLKAFVLHTPPFSIARSMKRAVHYNNPVFPVFKLIYDFGVLSGMTDKLRGRLLKTSRQGR